MSKEYNLDTGHLLPASEWKSEHEPVVLVACGSFSPITYLHLRIFEMARDYLRLARNIVPPIQVIGGYMSPTSDAYGKVGLASSQHRLEMCRLALKDDSNPWISVDCWEALQPVFIPTVRVLEHLEEELQRKGINARPIFLCGADLVRAFQDYALWERTDVERIVGHFGLVVVDRWGTDCSEVLLTDPILWRNRERIHLVKQYISNDISSTKIRLYLQRGLSVKYLLPDSVIEYISQHKDIFPKEDENTF